MPITLFTLSLICPFHFLSNFYNPNPWLPACLPHFLSLISITIIIIKKQAFLQNWMNQAMEETGELHGSKKCNTKTRAFKGLINNPHQLPLLQLQYSSHHSGYGYSYYPAPLQLALTPPLYQNQTFPIATSSFSDAQFPVPTMAPPADPEGLQWRKVFPSKASNGSKMSTTTTKKEALVVVNRPDSGGVEGSVISLLANHFLVKFDPCLKIYHYNVEISPNPSKDVARMIKQKLVETNSGLLCGAHPAYDGRKSFYSPIEFENDKLEFFVSLPIPTANPGLPFGETNGFQQNRNQLKVFRINIRHVSKFDGKDLSSYISNEGDDWIPLPQDYLHALDVILRENPMEKCISVGRSFYSSSMAGSKEIGGGAIGWRGFFQSLRPTQQGLALNVDTSITAFHESIGVIPYLQKRIDFLRDLTQRKTRSLTDEERKEVEKALRNIRVFVCHRETVQRYRVHGLTEDTTENLYFADRDGKNLKLVNYFKDHYNYDIQFRNLPCLQISRSKPYYLPMELCMICEGQKFLGKLSDDQTARILKMGCQRPKERKAVIDGIVKGPAGPTSGKQAEEFKLHVSREMTRLNWRILQPPKLKLGDGGHIRDITPSRRDRQWNLLNSHVFQGMRIERWALVSFGGSQEQKSNIPKFTNQLTQRCEQLGIFLNKSTIVSPRFESTQVLNNVTLLESKLKKIHRAASNNLQLLICIMEKKHKGYADLKRIAETSVGVVSQCCLYPNLGRLSSQFLANLALKINAKVGGSTVALYNSLPSQIPRLFQSDEPVIFMGADVTHPHPLDDSSPSVAAVVGSMNWPAANKYVSRMRSQTHREEIIQDLAAIVGELLDDFYQEVNKLPKRIIFFRDGVSETQFYKVLKEELQAVKEACSRFPCYKPPITFVVVQKRHHTRLFPFETDPFDDNIPPGTVVDTVITHPREFDFYLCSHWGVKGTSRPTHYHTLWDENQFTSDELQKLVYNLCYTFARCTKPVSLVPPAYYAHLAAYRGRLYLERSESIAFTRNSNAISRAAPPKATPLPKLSENVKKLMFYC